MQRVLGHDGEERNRFQPTNERWPGSKVWGRLVVLGTASLDEAREAKWLMAEAEGKPFWTLWTARACARTWFPG